MAYCGYITTLHGLRRHGNADRLQCVTVFGNNVVVDLSYYDGQKVVFFPVDGQLSEEYAAENRLVKKYVPTGGLTPEQIGNRQVIKKDGVDVVNLGGYMDPDKRNITAIRLRGEKSEGLVLPVETLANYTDIAKLKDGDRITALSGQEICRKYIPKKKVRGDCGNPKQKRPGMHAGVTAYPFFFEHADTEQLMYNKEQFKPGDTCYITLKMHGTSGRTANAVKVAVKERNPVLKKLFGLRDKEIRSYECISGTRRTVLRNYGGGYYGSNAFREKYHELFRERLPKGMEVFYEIVGYVREGLPIMGSCSNKLAGDKEFLRQYGPETTFSYGCAPGENDCYVYRMTMVNEEGFVVELPWEQVQIECGKMGVKTVPLFEKFLFTTWEDLMERVEKYYDGADLVGKTHIREGVVVRIDNRPSFTAYKHKNFHFKVLSGIIADALTDGQADALGDDVLSEL